MQIVTNNYPEYSRDDNFPVLRDAFRIQPFPTTFTDESSPSTPFGSGVPIDVPNPVPDLYYRKNEVHVDATPRLISPSQTLILQSADDYAYVPIFLGASGAPLRAVRQVSTTVVYPGTIITYISGSTVLYMDNGNGTFTDLVRDVDYMEMPSLVHITTITPPINTRIVGYVKSPNYLFYYEGPRAPAKIVIRRRSSADGVRALYNEPTGGPNDFREANKSNGSGAPIAAPYGIPQYLASSVKNNPAFGTDTEVIKIIDAGFTIKRVR
jgi:hypothetical protein